MPSTSPDNYRLVQITDKELVDFTRRQNSQAWKGVLSTQDYILREYVLGKCEMTKDLLVFMLQDTTRPNERLCSMELVVRGSTRYYKNGDKVEQKPIKSGCIGGVYTYPDHRGQGLAKIMIDKLVEVAKSEILLDDGYIFLYSEIGEYYSRSGFKSFGVDLLQMPIAFLTPNKHFPVIESEEFDHVNVPEGVLLTVQFDDFGPLLQEFKSLNEQDIIAKVAHDSKERVSLDISSHLIDWFHLRAKFISYKLKEYGNHSVAPIDFLNGSYDEIIDKLRAIGPKVFGLKLTNSKGLVGYIVWTYDYKTINHGYATIINIHVNRDLIEVDEVLMKLKLIEYMKEYVKQLQSICHYDKIVVWSCELPGVSLESLGTILDNPSRSAIQMDNESDQRKLLNGEIIWENNNKLPWF